MGKLETLAIAIADEYARSNIECYCRRNPDTLTYDLTDCDEQEETMVRQSADYIALRGEELPYRMMREGDKVRFEGR